MKVQQSKDIRRILPHTYTSFFGRFGRFTKVQLEVIPLILEGRNIVVSAPTAMGKTEAVVAPVAEQQAANKWKGLSVIYVVPTRALANDIYQRIEGPLREMNVSILLKHGDKSRWPNTIPNWVITTPESLDSLLGRHTQTLKSVRTIIVDEIHLLDNTYRGDQLRILLRRLADNLQEYTLSVHFLSATLPRPKELAQRYVTEFQIVNIDGHRAISPHFTESNQEIKQLAMKHRWKKILYFCNKRKSVEQMAHELQALWHPYPVVAHHGSLEKQQREDAEKIMKQNPVAIAVATTTLEIGIDIGKIDLIVLADPPWSIASLLQRIGRGSRRLKTIQAAALCQSEDERMHMAAMFDAAAAGTYTLEPYEPDLSVIVQQMFSLLFQYRDGGISKSHLMSLSSVLGNEIERKLILSHLIDRGFITKRGETLYPSISLMDMAEKGKIHSNVPDQHDLRVIDQANGRTIGRISGMFDAVFLLNGAVWRVISVQDDKLIVRRHSGRGGSSEFTMRQNQGNFYPLLPSALKISVPTTRLSSVERYA